MCNKHWIRTESNFLELIHVIFWKAVNTIILSEERQSQNSPGLWKKRSINDNYFSQFFNGGANSDNAHWVKKIGIWIQKGEMELSWIARLTQTIGKVLELK